MQLLSYAFAYVKRLCGLEEQGSGQEEILNPALLDIDSGSSTTSFLDPPIELRQRILSYIIDPTSEPSLSDVRLTLRHKDAIPLSQVCTLLRSDTAYVESQWQTSHTLRSVLSGVWSTDEEVAYQNLQRLYEGSGKPEGAEMILKAVDLFRAQRHEMRANEVENRIDLYQNTRRAILALAFRERLLHLKFLALSRLQRIRGLCKTNSLPLFPSFGGNPTPRSFHVFHIHASSSRRPITGPRNVNLPPPFFFHSLDDIIPKPNTRGSSFL
ncbi:hypothetical protein EJ08DRAFT_654391, partial [Tothia fuscella]